MTKEQTTKLLPGLPFIVALAVYAMAGNNFFYADDFIWLYRAKTLTHHVSQIFYPDVVYFDPLVHLSFYLNYLVGGLAPGGYHLFDLLVHAINAVLVCRLARLISADERTGIYAGILFASSYAIADAVLWSSSRVDLISTLFSLWTLISFVAYLQTGNRRDLVKSYLLFFLALSAKGTPVVLPIILFWLAYKRFASVRSALLVAPHCALVAGYFALLKLLSPHAVNKLPALNFSLSNMAMALSTFYIPERYLEAMNLVVAAAVAVALTLVLAFWRPTHGNMARAQQTGVIILVCALLPMLILRDFKLESLDLETVNLLASPSHRVYLASVGLAIVLGCFVRSLELRFSRFSVKNATIGTAVVITAIVAFNASEVARRDALWEAAAEDARYSLEVLKPYRTRFVEGAQVALVNFPGAEGFVNPMLRVFFNREDLTVLMARSTIGVYDQPRILENMYRSELLVLAADSQVYDLSPLFRQKLLANLMLLREKEKDRYDRDSREITAELNRRIAELIQRP